MTQKGLFLKNIKNNIKQKISQDKKKNRRVEIVICHETPANGTSPRHVGLNDCYSYGFNMNSLIFVKNVRETVEHFIRCCKKLMLRELI